MKNLCFLTVVLLLSSCQELAFRKKDERIDALNAMQQTDADFSETSRRKGFKQAFLEYIDQDGTLLRPNRMPIVGADAVEYLSAINDSSVVLTWEPLGGDVAKSGDMGYTYGTYIMKDSASESHGTYVTVWRKDPDGKWKFVLDSGNPGVGELSRDSLSNDGPSRDSTSKE
jgi:ketosteroid isomerase-like protein